MAYAANDLQKLLAEACDPRRTAVVCKRHNYSPGGPKFPTQDCSDCWFAFFLHHIAKLPPHKRAEKVEELRQVIHVACEAEDKGEFDFKGYRHPEIHIDKGAA